jgi:hypothetical protein
VAQRDDSLTVPALRAGSTARTFTCDSRSAISQSSISKWFGGFAHSDELYKDPDNPPVPPRR